MNRTYIRNNIINYIFLIYYLVTIIFLLPSVILYDKLYSIRKQNNNIYIRGQMETSYNFGVIKKFSNTAKALC